ncbi:MAG: hypothetical protein GPOALKHO_001847 [Sodalis sp.]|nr:MAG: hypothetical protein GPOALKHO_001847 [Sodalis sp.]
MDHIIYNGRSRGVFGSVGSELSTISQMPLPRGFVASCPLRTRYRWRGSCRRTLSVASTPDALITSGPIETTDDRLNRTRRRWIPGGTGLPLIGQNDPLIVPTQVSLTIDNGDVLNTVGGATETRHLPMPVRWCAAMTTCSTSTMMRRARRRCCRMTQRRQRCPAGQSRLSLS